MLQFSSMSFSSQLLKLKRINSMLPKENTATRSASHCCQTQTRYFDKRFFSCWCWRMQPLSKPLFLQLGHLSAQWYNGWCSFAVNQIRELLRQKIIQLKETSFCCSTSITFGAFRRQGKLQKNEYYRSPKKWSNCGFSHIISHWILFPSAYLLFFSFCCILTLLNLPLPHEVSQVSKESENTIAYIGQHSNQHWCFFKSFVERPFV